MIDWILNNIATIAVSALIAAALTAVVIRMVLDRRKGKHSCGSSCSGCAMSGMCHKR